jgi:hypothetical protein
MPVKHLRSISQNRPAPAGFFSVLFTWIHSLFHGVFDFVTGVSQLQPVGRDIAETWDLYRDNQSGK